MASNSQSAKISRAAVSGIPKAAQLIAALPAEDREGALWAAERSYRQTVRNLGYEQADAKDWVLAVMRRLRTKVEVRVMADRALLKSCRAREPGSVENGQRLGRQVEYEGKIARRFGFAHQLELPILCRPCDLSRTRPPTRRST